MGPVPVDLAPPVLEPVAESVFERGPHGPLAGGDRRWRELGDRRCELVGTREQLLARHDFAHERHAQGRPRVEALGAREQHHAHDLAEGHAPQEPDRLECEDLADADVRVEERRVIGADGEVGVGEEVEPRAEAHAVHGDDDRLVEADAQEVGRRAAVVRPLRGALGAADRAGLGGVLQVGPGAERLVAGSGQYDDPHLRVRRGVAERGGQGLLEQSVVQRVHALRTVQRERQDVSAALDQEFFGFHLVLRRPAAQANPCGRAQSWAVAMRREYQRPRRAIKPARPTDPGQPHPADACAAAGGVR